MAWRFVFFLYIVLNPLWAQEACLDLFKTMVQRHSRVNYQLNIDRAMRRVQSLVRRFPNEVQVSSAFSYDGRDVFRVDMPARSGAPKARVIITAGVHGNESVTTAGLIEFIEEIVFHSQFRNDFDFVFYPALNPGGLETNVRYLRNGADFNRTFREGQEERLTNLFKASLAGERFDLGLDLHEAYGKKGFFIIKAQEHDQAYIDQVVKALDAQDLLSSPTGQYPYNIPNVRNPNLTSYVLSSPGVSTSFNRGTLKSFFQEDLGVTHSYTLESPGQIELAKRKEVYKKLIASFLENF